MEIISIDIHSKKNANVYDGKLHSLDPTDLRQYLKNLTTGDEEIIVLINAPITGYVEEFERVSSFSPGVIRGIEYFFRNKGFGYSTTKVSGVSVSSYSSLAYWALIQNLFKLNLSYKGPASKFQPVFKKKEVSNQYINLVETHSNLALWLLTDDKSPWKLSDRKQNFSKFKKSFCRNAKLPIPAGLTTALKKTTTLDEFNCVFGYIMGYLWVFNGADFGIMGNRFTGSFLLPFDDSLLSSYKFFAQNTYLQKLSHSSGTKSRRVKEIIKERVFDDAERLAVKKENSKKNINGACRATYHAYDRAKERLGWKKKTLNRMMVKAHEEGLSHGEAKGKLSKYIDRMWLKNLSANNIRVYGQNLYIFDDNVLITIYRLPNYLIKYVDL